VAEPEIDARFAFTIMDTKESRHVSKEFGIDASRDFAVTVVNFSTLQVPHRTSRALPAPDAPTRRGRTGHAKS
jgi:hypothetical protein